MFQRKLNETIHSRPKCLFYIIKYTYINSEINDQRKDGLNKQNTE